MWGKGWSLDGEKVVFNLQIDKRNMQKHAAFPAGGDQSPIRELVPITFQAQSIVLKS